MKNRRRQRKFLAFGLIIALTISSTLSFLILNKSSIEQRSKAEIADNSVTASIDYSKLLLISKFDTGSTMAGNSLIYPFGANTKSNVDQTRSLVAKSTKYINQFLIGNGSLDPWPDPNTSAPTNWSTLDKRLQLVNELGATPVLTLGTAPWWMKVKKNGEQFLKDEEWSPEATQARISDDKIGSWLKLIEKTAERYMLPPYNVRYFQVWDHLNGYYNKDSGTYDYSDSAGDPAATGAKHGYTYLYNQTYTQLLKAAKQLGIPESEISVGGPYAPVKSISAAAETAETSPLKGSWGAVDINILNALEYWMEHKIGAGFVSLSGDNYNSDESEAADEFLNLEKFSAVDNWIKSLPDARGIDIWWTEFFISPVREKASEDINNALTSYLFGIFVQDGVSTAMTWSDNSEKPKLWALDNAGTKVTPTKWFSSFNAYHESFSAGTKIFGTKTSSDRVKILASEKAVLIINKSSQTTNVNLDGKNYLLGKYETLII